MTATLIKQATIGSGTECDIRIPDPDLAPIQASVILDDAGLFWLHHHGAKGRTAVVSVHGTAVYPVQRRALLAPGMTILINDRHRIPWDWML